jgi:hypothetical protein
MKLRQNYCYLIVANGLIPLNLKWGLCSIVIATCCFQLMHNLTCDYSQCNLINQRKLRNVMIQVKLVNTNYFTVSLSSPKLLLKTKKTLNFISILQEIPPTKTLNLLFIHCNRKLKFSD